MKHWLITAAMLLGSVITNAEIVLTEEDGLLDTTSENSAGVEQLIYESAKFTLESASNTLTFTFLEGYSSKGAINDMNGFPFVAIAEFYLYDNDGNEISLTPDNFYTNAQEYSEGPLDHICDDDLTTYFHSNWRGGASDYHKIFVTLPEGKELSEFSFKYVTRYAHHCVPKKIQINAGYEVLENVTDANGFTWTLNYNGDLTVSGSGEVKTGYVKNIISNYNRVRSLSISEGITSVDVDFRGCTKLSTISIPKSVVSMGDNGWIWCNLNEVHISDMAAWCNIEFQIPSSNPLFNANNLYLNGNLVTQLTIPNTVEMLKDYVFTNCTSITSAILPESVTSIGSDAFSGCSSLTSITLPESVTSIGSYAFSRCSSLTSITIPQGVTSIENNTFYNCSALTSITIPESVTSIGSDAFSGCSSLFADIHISSIEAWCVDGFSTIIPKNLYINGNLITELIIPNTVETIKDYAFNGCSALTSITIPESVTSIGYAAFRGCSSLTSITIPESVTSIGRHAFWGCTGELTMNHYMVSEFLPSLLSGNKFSTIIIPEGVTSIGSNAFRDCSSLTSITIPESVESIGGQAFYNCSALTSITIPEGVTSIGWYAFSGCSSLTSITIPESVIFIGDEAFSGCSALTSITIPESVTSIGSYAFSGCSSLTSIIVEEGNTVYDSRNDCNAIIETSRNTLIAGCSTTIIPEGVTSIGSYAFYNCSALTSITIPEGVRSIGYYAFNGCSALTSITIPESVISIGDGAFSGCSSLTSIIVEEGNTVFDSRNGCNAIIVTSSNTLIAGCSTTIIPEGVTSIGSYAFRDCSSLTSITLPESVTSIEYAAFSGTAWYNNQPDGVVYINDFLYKYKGDMPANTSIMIMEGTKYIVNSAFSGCSALTSITLPESVTSIGESAFSGCSALTSITIPEGVTSIGTYAFYGCSSLTSITIPEGVTSIGYAAFNGCSNLTSITIPEGVTSIGWYAFSDCSSLTSITIPESVTSIRSMAFSGCSSLTSIIVEEGNTVYDSRNDCNAIIETSSNTLIAGCSTTIIPESVTSIGGDAFYNCSALTSITLPESVTSIGDGAFSCCSSLTSITCKAITPPTIYSYTFDYVDRTIPVYVPAASVSDYQSAEYWNEFTNIQPLPSRKELLDSEENFTQAEDESFAEITYTRNYTGNWEALYVPFEITVDEAFLSSFEVAYINDVRSYDNDNNGEVDDMVMEAFKITSGTLRASYPYLIRAKNAGEATITVTDATLYATTAENMHSVNCSSVYMEYTVSGTYTTMTADQLDGCYAMSKGGAWIEASSPSATLRPFRLYLSMESRDDSYLKVNPTALKAIRLKVDGEETTAIEHSEFRIQNSELIYDLQGRRVENPGKGVYIVNGKKVIYK